MKNKRTVEPQRVPLHFDPEQNPLPDKVRSDISSCVRTGNYLWLAFDESTHIERLRWTGKSWAGHKSFSLFEFFEFPGDRDDEIDIEGLAYADHYLWVTGSQSTKRETPDEEDDISAQAEALAEIEIDVNRYTFGRIPCVPDPKTGAFTLHRECPHPEDENIQLTAMQMKSGKKKTKLTKLLRKDPHLKKFMKIPGKDNGFDIEGLAVRDGRVFVGLRGPVLRRWALVLELRLKEKKGYLKPRRIGPDGERYRKHFLDLNGMGVRELSLQTDNDSLLLLAGPTMDLDGAMSLWRLEGGLPKEKVTLSRNTERVYDIIEGSATEPGKDKAEGLALLDDGRILIVYDAPAAERTIGSHGVYADLYPDI